MDESGSDLATAMRDVMAAAALAGHRQSKHLASQRGHIHTPTGRGGNTARAVTRARRTSWAHPKKMPGPLWRYGQTWRRDQMK